RPRELQMAEKLIEGMTEEWDPARYKDRFHDDLLAFIDRKAREGKVEPVNVPRGPRRRGEVVDLMPLLRKSLEGKAGGGRSAGSGRTGRAAAGREAPRAGRPARARSAATGGRSRTARGRPTARSGARRRTHTAGR